MINSSNNKYQTPLIRTIDASGYFIQSTYNPTFAKPLLPTIVDQLPQNESSHITVNLASTLPKEQNSLVVQAPGGALDLSLYNYQPVATSEKPREQQKLISEGGSVEQDGNEISKETVVDEHLIKEIQKKKRKFKGPRRSSKLEKLIALLEDKRIMDDADAYQLEDIKMPRLRNVLNIIFITSGVCFLLAVVIVILYTAFATNLNISP